MMCFHTLAKLRFCLLCFRGSCCHQFWGHKALHINIVGFDKDEEGDEGGDDDDWTLDN